MRYLLDTNVVIGVMKRRAVFTERLRRTDPGDVAISSIVAHELYFGAYKSDRTSLNAGYVEAVGFTILDFDNEDARAAGLIRASLARAGTPIGPYDTLIAGQALARNLVVVTRNTREFGRVEGLAVEDWEGS